MPFNRISLATKVESSNIGAIGYDPETEFMSVEFKGGGEFLYKKIPKKTFDDFLASESKGKFFHYEIRGKFETVKIRSRKKEENGN